MDARGRSYSADNFGTLQLLTWQVVTIVGTNASDTAIADSMRRIMFPVTITGTGGIWRKTGGTSAGAILLLQYSLAGTGTWTSIGTFASGTAADGTVGVMGITETNLAAGDVVRLCIAAGTAAATPVVEVAVPFRETYVGS